MSIQQDSGNRGGNDVQRNRHSEDLGYCGVNREVPHVKCSRQDWRVIYLDERGIPILAPGEHCATYCPPNPCALCTGNSAVRKKDGSLMTSWEWCQQMKTCGATVDWEAIYGH